MSNLQRGLGAMPSVPMPIRGAKELVDSGRPYLKPSTKEEKKGKKSKSQKAPKVKRREKASAKKGTPREDW